MRIEKKLQIKVEKFTNKFVGKISSLGTTTNPYIQKATELAKANGIPERAVKDTNVVVNGDTVIFDFRWFVEGQAPEDKKKLILAFMGELPTDSNNAQWIDVYVESTIGIHKTIIMNYEEFFNDFKVDPSTIKIQNELQYIDSLNIDFFSIYGESLLKLFNFYDVFPSNENVKEFLKVKEVKEFIISEDPESLSDTHPRDILLGLYRDFSPERA